MQNPISEKIPFYKSWVFWAVIYGVLILAYNLAFIFLDPEKKVLLTSNELGDFLAGVFAPLAFLFLYLGYRQQAKQLSQNTKILMDQNKQSFIQAQPFFHISFEVPDLDDLSLAQPSMTVQSNVSKTIKKFQISIQIKNSRTIAREVEYFLYYVGCGHINHELLNAKAKVIQYSTNTFDVFDNMEVKKIYLSIPENYLVNKLSWRIFCW
ncbi:hypothetical protein [Acinetobacter pittii]|uniref:hypothetical protein n=1 Tax=Acinetobacter pittii TaxID=48296 RepID=UPI001D17D125|nr:hypothetical protein [Acinetobacter pittii]